MDADELRLLDPKVCYAKRVEALIEHPVLVVRPFVVSPNGTLLARPKERVKDVL
jgi:arsenate reductase